MKFFFGTRADQVLWAHTLLGWGAKKTTLCEMTVGEMALDQQHVDGSGCVQKGSAVAWEAMEVGHRENPALLSDSVAS